MNMQVPPPNSGPASLNSKTPVTIVTGFMGSGKTTVILHLVEQLQKRGEQISYIKNEEGEIDLDAKLLGGKHIVASELLNGCICCSLMGPFLDAVDEIIETYHPDRILVESSGTAEPGNMAITVGGHHNIYRDGIVEVVDAVNFGGYKEVNEYWKMQTNLTDLILLNKVEQVDENQKELVMHRIRDLNGYSPILETRKGWVEVDLVFGVASRQVEKLLSQQSKLHEHDLHMETVKFESEGLFEKNKMVEVLQSLPENVVRYKGWVKLEDGKTQVLNGVFRRHEWFASEGVEGKNTKLVFFGSGIDKDRGKIVELVKQCEAIN